MEDFTCWWTDDGEGALSMTFHCLTAHRAATKFAEYADDEAGGEISEPMLKHDRLRRVSVRSLATGAETVWRVSCHAMIVWSADQDSTLPASERVTGGSDRE
jgi:hypothetical protein